MQAIARWLVARPQNAVFALAITLLLPAPQLTSGAIMALLVLVRGIRSAAIQALVAGLVLVFAAVLLGGSLKSVAVLVAGTLVPVALLSYLLVALRSLTLALQVSVIVAIAGLLVFQVVIVDPAQFWQPYLDAMADAVRDSGLQLDLEMLTADMMTMSAALVFWALITTATLFGYAMSRRVAAETVQYGRFQDLNFGRVIALALAVVSLLAFAIGAAWLQNIAFVLFVMFMMQGLAIVHWLRSTGLLPAVAVVSIYVMMPFLQVLLVLVLALIGYTDAWFEFRRRWENSKGSKK